MSENLQISNTSNTNKTGHVIFVDTKKQKKNFNAAKYFDTEESLIGRSFNRPKKQTLHDK
eukprot:Pgem_evm1s10076